MKKDIIRNLFGLLIVVLLAGCGQTQSNPVIDDVPTSGNEQVEQGDDVNEAGQDEALTSGENTIVTCYGSEIHPIGQEIASQYEEVTYEQVMDWFCNGANFEDILVALQTAKQTGEPAQSLLEMLAAGQTWDEIWQSVGLTD